MSHWNYRMMLKDGQVAVHEVFYADDGSIQNFTVEPVYPRAENPECLAEEFERYRQALTEPLLDFATLKQTAEKRLTEDAAPGNGPQLGRVQNDG